MSELLVKSTNLEMREINRYPKFISESEFSE